MKLEALKPRSTVRGVLPDSLVTVVSVQWFGSEALELTYKTPDGVVANELLYRQDEERLEIVAQGRPWSFDGDGALFRLVSEAQRIRRMLHTYRYARLQLRSGAAVRGDPAEPTMKLEALKPRSTVRGVLPDSLVTVVSVQWFGSEALELTYKTPDGVVANELLYRQDEERLEIVAQGRPWSTRPSIRPVAGGTHVGC